MATKKRKTKRANRKIDYQEILHNVAKSMVHLRQPERLLKMITRFVSRELGLTHTSFAVYDNNNKRFIFIDSKGASRIPVGLLRIDEDHPLVQWFTSSRSSASSQSGLSKEYLDRKRFQKWLQAPARRNEDHAEILKTLDMLKVELAIPALNKKTLVGLLLCGKRRDGKAFSKAELSFFQTLAHDSSMAIRTAQYHQDLIERNEELATHVEEVEKLRKKERETYYEIMRSLAQEVHAKDPYTFGHVGQVERLGIMTAKELKMDLSGRNKDILSAGLILHDVGKIGIPDHILKKPARLNEEEWEVMQTHAEKGAKILEHLSDFKEVAEIVRSHHERWDGKGYPRGISGEAIPIQARIVCVVDAFHAIVSTRCYSKGRPIDIAFDELRRCAGSQFDPKVVEAFIRGLQKNMKKRGVDFFMDDPTIKTKNLVSKRLSA